MQVDFILLELDQHSFDVEIGEDESVFLLPFGDFLLVLLVMVGSFRNFLRRNNEGIHGFFGNLFFRLLLVVERVALMEERSDSNGTKRH